MSLLNRTLQSRCYTVFIWFLVYLLVLGIEQSILSFWLKDSISSIEETNKHLLPVDSQMIG